jgi:hypothetical protein
MCGTEVTTSVNEVLVAQADLFRPPSIPEGFSYRSEIISAAEEAALASEIAALPLEAFRFQGFVAKRRVISFGWRYDFERARFEEADPIPDFLLPLKARAAASPGSTARTSRRRWSPNMPPARRSAGIATVRCSRT